MKTVDQIRKALEHLLSKDKRNLILGEDILDPYGGAFKATQGLSTKLRRVLKSNFWVIFTSAPDLKQILYNYKTPLPRNSQPGVYSFECNCGKIYIGERLKRKTKKKD